MTKHDDIVLSLTDDKILELIRPHFGARGAWSEFAWFLEKPHELWTIDDLTYFIESHKDWAVSSFRKPISQISLEDLEQRLLKIKEIVHEGADLFMEKTFEFPLIKGSGQYKTTKGFVDLIIHARPRVVTSFSTYPNDALREYVIEIKTESDFKDVGQILRQIKEYRNYYGSGYSSGSSWCSDVSSRCNTWRWSSNEKITFFCVLADKIPDKVKPLFENEKILLLDLSAFESKQKKLEVKKDES